MPVLGLVRNRRHLLARQSAFGSVIPAVRAYPFSGTPTEDEQWTDPEGDFGSIDPVAAPYRQAGDYGAGLTLNPLNYNDITQLLSGFFGGGVIASGGPAYTRVWTPDSQGADDFDVYSYEFGDDADGSDSDEPNDWFQNGDGTVSSFTIDSPETGAGVLTADEQFTFTSFFYAGSTDNPPASTIPSISDVPDTDPTQIYLKDAKVYIDSDASDIGGTQISDSVHKFTLRGTQELDKKWYVNGTQSFAPQNYGRGKRTIELDLIYAKTPDTVGVGSESDAWSANQSVPRFVTIAFESLREADTGTFYSWLFSMPLRYYTRTEGNIGGNSTVNLTAHAFFEPDVLDYVFYSELVNTLADADL
jgi:hypothetical protein